MASLSDYFKWRGDITFDKSPLNEIDSLIFTQLCYIPLKGVVSKSFEENGITIKQYYEENVENKKNLEKMGALIPNDKIWILCKYAANSPRFENVRMRGYVREIDNTREKQFCALCFDLPDNTTYISFCGTDDTIVGWKEDFNMALFTPVPAQNDSVEYLNKFSETNDRKIYLGGHSKGGNLAIYAGFMSNERARNSILAIHNFDGPGFRYDFLRIARKNTEIASKVINFLPDSTIIGAIFDTIGARIYVRSRAKGVGQHDLFTWYLQPATNFMTVDKISKTSIQFHNTLERWVANMDDKEKVEFIDAFYKLCKANDSDTLTDIMTNKRKFVSALFNVDEKSKKVLWRVMSDSVKEYFVGSDVKPVAVKDGKKIQLEKTAKSQKAKAQKKK